ncbi:hypothetical protein NHX12_020349 [Muraenolepis orangiensis]|uniref:Uncharacterized protein n=1 Tax=Muraenolepis orangiensis TaxID=630683 RepID=A0A9Q0ISX2_9TELE|nr:hypothetical protein NHX12_020349 [Muraenolepis orangiensis]
MTSVIVMYVFGAIMMAISILGAFGAHRENRVALIVVSKLRVALIVVSKLRVALIVVSKLRVALIVVSKLRVALIVVSKLRVVLIVVSKLRVALIVVSKLRVALIVVSKLRVALIVVSKLRVALIVTCFPVLMHYVHKAFNICLAVLFSLATLAPEEQHPPVAAACGSSSTICTPLLLGTDWPAPLAFNLSSA